MDPISRSSISHVDPSLLATSESPTVSTTSAQCTVPPARKKGPLEGLSKKNLLMLSDKKLGAERVVSRAFKQIKNKVDKEPLDVVNAALNNVKPVIEVKSRRVGGATYQVPVEVPSLRSDALAMRWVRQAAGKRNEKSMAARLAGELLDASEDRGGAIKKRNEVHQREQANKAFARYRF